MYGDDDDLDYESNLAILLAVQEFTEAKVLTKAKGHLYHQFVGGYDLKMGSGYHGSGYHGGYLVDGDFFAQ